MSAMDMFWAMPPVTRTLIAAAVGLSWPAHLINTPDPYYLYFLDYKVLTLKAFPELWRLVTPFLLTGPKLGLILDPYFLYQYGSELELRSSRFSDPGDFLVYMVFVSVVILVVCGYFMGGIMFMSPLTLALAYTYAQENPQRQLSYFVVTFSAKYLPYCMLAMTFLMASPEAAFVQSSGLIAAHMYEFLAKIWPEYGGGRSIISTPVTVRRWFETPGGTAAARPYGTAISGNTTTVPQRATGSGGGWTSGAAGAWNARGSGRRLGD
ncbi:hypothetical protein LTR95_004092 [Oleoguttula sp. CCFEE 5521]|uniref:Derlin n=1 Tax=Cryoendolithus antarcticus TaxID=1507870 RepID=A0A1V8SX10_9PEZI|nr:hypothetical protein B0A48_10361 [Cryoendolithus antarcticus]